MDKPSPQITPLWILVVLGVAIWACLAVWVAVANRRRRGLPVLPYQPRRQVPWRVLDLLAMLAIYLALQAAALLLVHAWLGPQLTRPPHIYNLQQTSTQNIAVKLLKNPEPSVLLCCGLAVVVVAPIVEEFLYRVLLQGWLEAAQRRYRRAMPTLRRLLPGAVGPVFLSSFLFARAHFRTAAPAMNVYYVTLLLVGNMLASLLTMGLAIGLLRLRVRASAADFGWVPEKFLADVRLGLLAFVAVAAPVYMLQIALSLSLPKYFAPDPFTLFVFALALGTLYYRTHRIVPAIVVHMSLNATTMAMALLSGCV